MAQKKLFISFLFVTVLATGCKSSVEKSMTESKQDEIVAMKLGKAKVETKEAFQAIEDYSYARKAEFVTNMNKELVELQEELDHLATKVENSSGEAKADAKARIEAVRGKWAQTKQQLNQAENATESAWGDVKKGFKETYAGLKDSIETTRHWLSDKIAP